MATTTTNFGWDIPQSTDLVKDGATAIAALGQDIDTAFIDLKGGTTGQVLAKASNTDLDYSWVAQDDSNAIQNAIIDAKGDLIGATAADTPSRLAVGTNGQVLTADSTTGTGLKWATPASAAIQVFSLHDAKTNGTNGGTFTSGAWRTRDLNTTLLNTISGASLASNQITLPAGTYFVQATAPSFGANSNNLRWYNITDSSQVAQGANNYAATALSIAPTAVMSLTFTIAGTKTFELQHYGAVTQASTGFGIAGNMGLSEIYAQITIAKVA